MKENVNHHAQMELMLKTLSVMTVTISVPLVTELHMLTVNLVTHHISIPIKNVYLPVQMEISPIQTHTLVTHVMLPVANVVEQMLMIVMLVLMDYIFMKEVVEPHVMMDTSRMKT